MGRAWRLRSAKLILLTEMLRIASWVLKLAPGVILVALGLATLVARFNPWVADRVGHPPLWLSLAMLLLGLAAVSLVLCAYLILPALLRRRMAIRQA